MDDPFNLDDSREKDKEFVFDLHSGRAYTAKERNLSDLSPKISPTAGFSDCEDDSDLSQPKDFGNHDEQFIHINALLESSHKKNDSQVLPTFPKWHQEIIDMMSDSIKTSTDDTLKHQNDSSASSLQKNPNASTQDSSQNVPGSTFGDLPSEKNLNPNNIEEIKESPIRDSENCKKKSETPQKESTEKSTKGQSGKKNKYKQVFGQTKDIYRQIFQNQDQKVKKGEKKIKIWDRYVKLLKKIQKSEKETKSEKTFEDQQIKRASKKMIEIKQNGETVNAKEIKQSEKLDLKIARREQEIAQKEEKIKEHQSIIDKIEEDLKAKRISVFCNFYEIRDKIRPFVKVEDSTKYYKSYWDKGSNQYFEEELSEEELYYWIINFKIAFVFIPSGKEALTLSNLTEFTIPYMAWIEDSQMGETNKIIYKSFGGRSHLRNELEEVFDKLLSKAQDKIEKERWEDFEAIIETLDGEKSQKRAYSRIRDESSGYDSEPEAIKKNFEYN